MWFWRIGGGDGECCCLERVALNEVLKTLPKGGKQFSHSLGATLALEHFALTFFQAS